MISIAQSETPTRRRLIGRGGGLPLIAHVIQHLRLGGLENGLVNLINHSPHDRFRHAVICLSDFSEFRERLTDSGVPVIALGKRAGKDPAHYVRLFRALRVLKPAIVHTRNLSGLDSVVIAALAGVPHRVHGEHGWDMADLRGDRRRYRVYRRLVRPLVDRFVAVSRHIADWLVTSAGVPPERIVQIYNGVDTQRFVPAASGREPLPMRGFVPADGLVIGCVGRLQTVKNQTLLARAFVRLLEQRPGARDVARLVIVGEGPLHASILDILTRGGCAELAWLPGARDDIAELLRSFDVFVLPSLNEGISNTILEAMASGLPVIATRVGGNPELVEEGATGRLVSTEGPEELATALGDYLDRRPLVQAHGRAGRERVVARFSLERMVQGYVELYGRLIAGRAVGAAT